MVRSVGTEQEILASNPTFFRNNFVKFIERDEKKYIKNSLLCNISLERDLNTEALELFGLYLTMLDIIKFESS